MIAAPVRLKRRTYPLVLTALFLGGCGGGTGSTSSTIGGATLPVALSTDSVATCLRDHDFTIDKQGPIAGDVKGVGGHDAHGTAGIIIFGGSENAREVVARHFGRRDDVVARTTPSGEATLAVKVTMQDDSLEAMNTCAAPQP